MSHKFKHYRWILPYFWSATCTCIRCGAFTTFVTIILLVLHLTLTCYKCRKSNQSSWWITLTCVHVGSSVMSCVTTLYMYVQTFWPQYAHGPKCIFSTKLYMDLWPVDVENSHKINFDITHSPLSIFQFCLWVT